MPEGPPNPNASDRAPVESPTTPASYRSSGFGWINWFGWIVAAVAILCAIYLGYRSSALRRQLENTRGQVGQLSATQAQFEQELLDLKDAFTSPDAKQVTLTETRGPARPIGHANYLAKTGTLIFVATNLHPISQSKTYELWLIPANGKAPIPAGLFRPDASGSGSVVLPPIPKDIGVKAFGVTIEVASGSQTPTLPIVMAGQ